VSRDVARALLEQIGSTSGARVVYGTATARNTVALDGAATAVELPAVVDVEAGDYAAVLAQGADRLIVGPVGKSGVVFSTTNDAVAGSGWSVTALSTWIRADESEMQFRIDVERTGAAVSVNASTGNIVDVTVATLPSRCRGNVAANLQVTGGAGTRGAFGAYNPSTGAVRLYGVVGSIAIATGEVLSLGGVVWLTQ